MARYVEETSIEKKENQNVIVTIDIHISEKKLPLLKDYLVNHPSFNNFAI